MTEVRLRTVDAFTDRPFMGNPAAVVLVESAPSEEWMAAVARETNLSDTGFVICEDLPDADFRLRWFTRGAVEVDLCGHATLASAHCLFEDGVASPIRFATRSGVLIVTKHDDGRLAMDFPAASPVPVEEPAGLVAALGVPVAWTGLGGDLFLLALLADEQTVRDLTPDIAALGELQNDVVVPTAVAEEGSAYDFVSRVFAPKIGLDEDPVTGSAHTVLAPYWAERLGRNQLAGLQASARPGIVGVEVREGRIIVSGHAVTILDGTLKPRPEMTRETDRGAPAGVAVVSQVFERWASGDLAGMLEVFDDGCEVRPLLGQLEGAVYRGHDGVRRWFTDVHSDWSVFSPELQRFGEVADSLLVAGRVRVRGRHSGVDLDTKFWWRFTFRDGRILVMEASGEPTEAHRAAGLASS